MKKVTFIFVVLLFLGIVNAKADQLAWITKAQAQKAVKLLKKQRWLVLYCACCDGDEKKKVKIKNVTYRHPLMQGKPQKEYYTVVVTAKIDGKWKEMELDLAYAHVKKKRQAHCLGKVLGFECDPCTKPFSWKV